MWLHLAVDKACVMSLGSLVLTVGELTCFFLHCRESKVWVPRAGSDDESVDDLRPPQKTPPPPRSRKSTVIPRFFRSCPTLFAWLCLSGSVHRCLKGQMENPRIKCGWLANMWLETSLIFRNKQAVGETLCAVAEAVLSSQSSCVILRQSVFANHQTEFTKSS